MRISVRSVSKRFDDEAVLSDVDLTVDDGEFCVVVGPSGCGKSTLLKCIAGLTTPETGTVRFDDRDVTDVPVTERELGFVFQDFEERLFPHLTVAENVAFALRHGDRVSGADAVDERVDDALATLAIPETRSDYPPNLSGGQQQRVELARNLVRDCEAFLLDDPLSDLDYKLQKEMELELRRLHAETGATYLYVTHNQDQALKLADTLVVLNDGRIEQAAPPVEVYEGPATAFVCRFVGDSNLLAVDAVDAVDDDADADFAVETAVGRFDVADTATPPAGPGVALVRPEDVRLGTAAAESSNALEGRLADRIYTGVYTEFVVAVDGVDEEFQVRRPGDVPLAEVGAGIDEPVTLGWQPTATQYFDESRYSAGDTVSLTDLQQL